jgi:hypothetical protein
MKVCFFATRVPDMCGAFLHDIDLAIELKSRGHSVVWMTLDKPREGFNGGTYRGFRFMHYSAGSSYLDSSQVWICPHAPALPDVRRVNAKGYNRPIIATCHFDGRYQSITKNGSTAWNEMLFFINKTMEASYRTNIVPFPPTIVKTDIARPILHESKLRIEDEFEGEYITLVNANVNKGVHQFFDLAKKMPDRKFLAVIPYYGELQPPPAPPNVEWTPFHDDIRTILVRTRILVMPSYYESYGRIAVEAMYNGIPVLYSKPQTKSIHPGGSTEGVEEWIRPVGVGCTRDSVDEWADAITALDDPVAYTIKRTRCKEHIKGMEVFKEASRIASQVEVFVRENPVVLDKAQQVQKERSHHDLTAAPAFRPPQPTGRVGFAGGRLKIR